MRNAAFFKLAAGVGIVGILLALALLLGVPGLVWLALATPREARDSSADS